MCDHILSKLVIVWEGKDKLGPTLDNVGDRLTSAALRLRVVDGTTLNPDTAMPAYYRTHNLQQVSAAYRNQPVLSAQEVEDVVAWLSQLRGAHANQSP